MVTSGSDGLRIARIVTAVASVALIVSCYSGRQIARSKETLAIVQDACIEPEYTGAEDGWGNPLFVTTLESGKRIVASGGRDGLLDVPLTEYAEHPECGPGDSLDADIVCMSGVLYRWPLLNTKAERRLLRLPKCDGP